MGYSPQGLKESDMTKQLTHIGCLATHVIELFKIFKMSSGLCQYLEDLNS